MKILILGGSGVVGYHAAAELRKSHDIFTAALNSKNVDFRLDVSDKRKLGALVAKVSPGAVLNAVKPPLSVDAMETEREIAYKLNTLLPENLARLQAKHGFKLVQVSTDGVYEGKEGVVYSEESPPYPQNYYCLTKLLAEERIRRLSSDYLILRTEGVFGYDERRTNFFLRLKDAAAQGKEFPAAADQFSQPIFGGELARAIRLLLEKGASGVYNVVSPDFVSRFELAQRICGVMGWQARVTKASIKGRKIPVQPHLRVSISKLEREIGRIAPLAKQLEALRGWNHPG